MKDSYNVVLKRDQYKTYIVVHRNGKAVSKFNVSGKPYKEQQDLQSKLANVLFDISH